MVDANLDQLNQDSPEICPNPNVTYPTITPRRSCQTAEGLAKNKEQQLDLSPTERQHALRLPFRDMSFDVVVNVEASHVYRDDAAFLQEVSRVLARGGKFLYADYRRRYNVPALERLARDTGFSGTFHDITANVVAACQLDAGRRQALIHAAVPWYLSRSRKRTAQAVRGGPGNCELRAFPGRRPTVLHGLSDAAAMMYAPCGTTTALRICLCGACSGAGCSGPKTVTISRSRMSETGHDQPLEASAMAVCSRA